MDSVARCGVISLSWWILVSGFPRIRNQELETRNQELGTRNQELGTILMWDLLWHYTMECLRLIAQTICGYSTKCCDMMDWIKKSIETHVR